MDVVEKLYPSIKRGSFHVNERQLVCDHLFSPLNLSHIPCGLNTHSPISSPLASPFLSSPSPAFPNPSVLLAGQACPPNFSPHGYFRTPRLSTIQTLLSYWRCCRCSTPWPGCWTAGPRTLNNPKANEPSHLDTTLHPGHNLRQTARFRPGRAPISLPRSIPSCFHFLAPCPDLQSSPAPHTFLAHLWELPLETNNLHTLSRTFFTPWLHWHPSSTEVKLLSFVVVQSLSHVQLCDPVDCSTPGFLFFTISQHLLRLIPTETLMPSNHLILCCPLLLLPSIFPSIRVFSNELALHIRCQSIAASASASVLPVNIQGWFPLG